MLRFHLVSALFGRPLATALVARSRALARWAQTGQRSEEMDSYDLEVSDWLEAVQSHGAGCVLSVWSGAALAQQVLQGTSMRWRVSAATCLRS